jgi:hypothetical protein
LVILTTSTFYNSLPLTFIMSTFTGQGLYTTGPGQKPGYVTAAKHDNQNMQVILATPLRIESADEMHDWQIAESLGHQFFENYRPNPNFDGRMQFPKESRERFCDIKFIGRKTQQDFDTFIENLRNGTEEIELSHAQAYADFLYPGSCCYIITSLTPANVWQSALIYQEGDTFDSYSQYYEDINELLDKRNELFNNIVNTDHDYITARQQNNKVSMKLRKQKLRELHLNDCAYNAMIELYGEEQEE